MRVLFLSTLIVLTGCATAQYSPTEEEVNRSTQLMHIQVDCFNRGAAILDDRVTQANIVANAVYAYCSKEIDATLRAYARKSSADPDYINGFATDPEAKASVLQLITNSVLNHRATTKTK